MLELIERGVDIFESCFPYQVTERGCALSFIYSYHLDPDGDGICLSKSLYFACGDIRIKTLLGVMHFSRVLSSKLTDLSGLRRVKPCLELQCESLPLYLCIVTQKVLFSGEAGCCF